jgi:hypothetical protein
MLLMSRSSKGKQTLVLAGVKKHHGEFPVFVALFSRGVVYLGYYASNNFVDLYCKVQVFRSCRVTPVNSLFLLGGNFIVFYEVPVNSNGFELQKGTFSTSPLKLIYNWKKANTLSASEPMQ